MTTSLARVRFAHACANPSCASQCDRTSQHCLACRTRLRVILGVEATSACDLAVRAAYRAIAAERQIAEVSRDVATAALDLQAFWSAAPQAQRDLGSRTDLDELRQTAAAARKQARRLVDRQRDEARLDQRAEDERRRSVATMSSKTAVAVEVRCLLCGRMPTAWRGERRCPTCGGNLRFEGVLS